MTDILKKPVHPALLKDSPIQKMSGKLEDTPASIATLERVPLPKEEKQALHSLKNMKTGPSLVKQSNARVNLKVVYDRLPKLSSEQIPDCNSCVGVCCIAFIVELTEDEYTSGLYGDHAIKITPEIAKQFKGKMAVSHLAVIPQVQTIKTDAKYFLEGELGQPCPFLTETNKCGIYDIRPITCRVYTCVGDDRITDDMRSGKEPPSTVVTNIIGNK